MGVASYGQTSSTYTNDNAVGIDILKNRLSPSNPNFLTPYQDVNFSNLVPPNIGIHLRQGTYAQSDFNNTLSIIAQNTMDTRAWLESTTTSFNFYNYSACIKVENSANVYGNAVNRPINSSGAPIIYLGGTSSGGPNIRVSENMLSRGTNAISAYVQGANSDAINAVTITNNTFDSSYIDFANTNENVGLNISPTWIFEKNKNQFAYAPLVLNDNTFGIAPSFFGIPGGSQNQLLAGASSSLPTGAWVSHGPPSVLDGADSSFNNVTLSFNNTVITEIAIQVDLGSRLPDGVTIQAIKLGVVSLSGNTYSGVGTFTVSSTASSQDTNFSNVSFATATGTILDPNWGILAGNVDNTQTSNSISWTLTGANNHNVTQYLTITIAGSDQGNFVTSRTKSIVFYMLAAALLSAGQQDVTLSPLVVKYKW